jgi:hypothetical protein
MSFSYLRLTVNETLGAGKWIRKILQTPAVPGPRVLLASQLTVELRVPLPSSSSVGLEGFDRRRRSIHYSAGVVATASCYRLKELLDASDDVDQISSRF